MENSGRTEANLSTSRVYCETTLPLCGDEKKTAFFLGNNNNATKQTDATTKTKKLRRDKSDLGENFIAPDGGWAWVVCIAAGISNLSVYPALQQFGFLFRERMSFLGLSSSEVTTIINTNSAISACTGLLNGPMFRRFTFRQVALAGSLIIFLGLLLTGFCASFLSYMVSYSLLYGFGMGISVSSSSLAINTYFKNKRRRAAGYSWTITGLGPIVLPHFVTYLLPIYGVQGTVFIFAAMSLHTVICALIYQPVHLHAPKPEPTQEAVAPEDPEVLCKYCTLQQKKQTGIFSSQYLYQADDADMPGYEIIEPGTPMLSRANDGWYGSKISLSSMAGGGKMRHRSVSSASNFRDMDVTARLNKVSEEELKSDEFFKPNNFNRERDEVIKHSNSKANFEIGPSSPQHSSYCTCAEERALLEQTQLATIEGALAQEKEIAADKDRESSMASLSLVQKIIVFFDLDLLRDFTYVNLVAGLTMINFGELNFSILVPFILNDFGFSTSQITVAMSVMAGLDITFRFLVPFITEKIPWDNRVFFLIGVVGIALGRTVVAGTRSYSLILFTFAWIGVWKGVRTIFWPLIIPGYVPLKRLPAASGLQLLITGLFSMIFGPFVGLIRDSYDYSMAIHFLNLMSFLSATSWALEAFVRRYLRSKQKKRIHKTEL